MDGDYAAPKVCEIQMLYSLEAFNAEHLNDNVIVVASKHCLLPERSQLLSKLILLIGAESVVNSSAKRLCKLVFER